MLIIDLNSVAIAHWHAKKMDSDEALGAFQLEFKNLLKDLELYPRDVIAVYDRPGSRKARQAIYPNYKIHRTELTEEERESMTHLFDSTKEFLKGLGVILASTKIAEADDLIYKFINIFTTATVWTNDSDFFALPVDIYYRHKFYSTTDEVPQGIDRKLIPLYRTLVGDAGDFGRDLCSTGFGDAAFKKIESTFGSEAYNIIESLLDRRKIDALLEDIEKLPALKKLVDHKDKIYKCWQLVKPVVVPCHKIIWEPGLTKTIKNADTPIFADYYVNELGVTQSNYNVAIEDLKEQIKKGHPVTLDLETYHVDESLEWMKNYNEKQKSKKSHIIVDPLGCKITGVGIKCGNFAGYFSFNHKDTDNLNDAQLNHLLDVVEESRVIYAHNAVGFELPVIYKNTNRWLKNVVDTKLMASYVNENKSKGLKQLSKRYLNYKQVSYKDTVKGRQMNELILDEVLSYGLDDVYTTDALANFFNVVMKVEDSYSAFYQCEVKSAYLTARAYTKGVRVDLNRLKELEKEDYKEYQKASNEVIKFLIEQGYNGITWQPVESITPKTIKLAIEWMTGQSAKFRVRKVDKVIDWLVNEFTTSLPDGFIEAIRNDDVESFNKIVVENSKPKELKVNSDKVMRELLYDFMGYPVRFRNEVTKTQIAQGKSVGSPSCDNDALNWILAKDVRNEDEKKFIGNIIRMREYLTRKGLYYEPYPLLIHWSDGRVHCNLNQCGTTSRRFAPNKPNLNQLPKKGEGLKVREIIIPEEGHAIISRDFSGQELRLCAARSGDENMMSCYIGDDLKDLHSLTAVSIDKLQDNICGGDYNKFIELKEKGDKKIKAIRSVAKGVNFLSAYGGSEFTLAKKLIISEDEAAKLLRAKEAAYPGVEKWKRDTERFIKKHRYSLSVLGARRHLDKYFYGGEISGHWIRSGLNFTIQGSAAEQTKLVMSKLLDVVDNFGVVFYFPVHDELVMSVPKEKLEEFDKVFKSIMEIQFYPNNISSVSDRGVGPNLGQLQGE